MRLKEAAANIYIFSGHTFGLLTARMRILPDFMIIGTQKGGTTALFKALRRHPQIATSIKKEVHFYDLNYGKGLSWYRAHFPSLAYTRYLEMRHKGPIRVGEASPYYLFHPSVPARIQLDLPAAKFIVLLRNPVDRAYAHYQHLIRKGRERGTFENVLRKENLVLEVEKSKLMKDPDYHSRTHGVYSLRARGEYIEQLQNWVRYFSLSQFLILRSEQFFSDPSGTMDRVTTFLEVDPVEPAIENKPYGSRYPPMKDETRQVLTEYFRPLNVALSDYLGENFNWDQYSSGS